MDKDKKIFELFKLLDDIDTAGDMAKSDDKAFRKLANDVQKKRWDVVPEKMVNRLYKKYYHGVSDMPHNLPLPEVGDVDPWSSKNEGCAIAILVTVLVSALGLLNALI